MALTQTTADDVREWIIAEIEALTPLEYDAERFNHMQFIDLSQDGRPGALKNRTFGLFMVSRERSAAIWGAYRVTYEAVIAYQDAIIESDQDVIDVHFDQMSQTDYGTGVIGVSTAPTWQVGEDAGIPAITLHMQVIIDYYAKGAN